MIFPIINEDIFATKKVPAKSIDLVVTSPPYNVDIKYNSHDDQVTYAEYLEFLEALDDALLPLAQGRRPVLPQHPA